MARTSDRSQAKSYYQHYLEGTTPPSATGAVNLALINTTPEQLAAMAKANGYRMASAAQKAALFSLSFRPQSQFAGPKVAADRFASYQDFSDDP